MAPNPNLRRLREAGVSIWLDTLARELLETGEFAELIDDYGVTGATSNPTIFAKANRALLRRRHLCVASFAGRAAGASCMPPVTGQPASRRVTCIRHRSGPSCR